MNWSDLSNFQITCPFPYLKKNYKFVFLDTEIKQREKTKESGYSLRGVKLIRSYRNYAQLYPRLSFPSRNQTEIMRERSICWWDDSLEVEGRRWALPSPSPPGINTSQEQTAIRQCPNNAHNAHR